MPPCKAEGHCSPTDLALSDGSGSEKSPRLTGEVEVQSEAEYDARPPAQLNVDLAASETADETQLASDEDVGPVTRKRGLNGTRAAESAALGATRASAADVQSTKETISDFERQLSLSQLLGARSQCGVAEVRAGTPHGAQSGLRGLVPGVILSAKDADGRLQHQRGAYQPWRELIRSFRNKADADWFDRQFVRWGILMEELVSRLEEACFTLERAERPIAPRC